jgi:hypothetical protein
MRPRNNASTLLFLASAVGMQIPNFDEMPVPYGRRPHVKGPKPANHEQKRIERKRAKAARRRNR